MMGTCVTFPKKPIEVSGKHITTSTEPLEAELLLGAAARAARAAGTSLGSRRLGVLGPVTQGFRGPLPGLPQFSWHLK